MQLLAVVFAKFKAAEKKKYKRLYQHKRYGIQELATCMYFLYSEALHRAFDLLKDDNDQIVFIDFIHFMQKYSPRRGERIVQREAELIDMLSLSLSAPHEVMCIFKVLQASGGVDGCLTWKEFSNFFEYEHMKWELVSALNISIPLDVMITRYIKLVQLSLGMKKQNLFL